MLLNKHIKYQSHEGLKLKMISYKKKKYIYISHAHNFNTKHF